MTLKSGDSSGGGNEGSQIFVGHRALGFVSDGVPLVCRYVQRRRENLIVTSVGRAFHTYGGSKLGLLSVSKIHPHPISVLAADTYLVFSGAGDTVYAWRRGTELKHVYKGHSGRVTHILPFGPSLITADNAGELRVWDIKTAHLLKTLEFAPPTFEITAICHPLTYKDKILLGSRQGPLKLFNLKTEKQIYRFKGWDSPVTVLEACPSVLDAVAIGLESGDIVVLNLKFDEEFVRFKQDWGPVRSLSFRSDRTDILISGSGSGSIEDRTGHIAMWDLNERKMAGQMRDAHQGHVTGLHCLPGEPVLVTSSPDNTVKQWIFDLPDGGGRLLRIKEGHSDPPTKIRFYGNLGNNVLSASEDSSLRSFSTVTELLNKSFGVASYNRKLSKKHKKIHNPAKMRPIVDFTTETTREQEWDNVACVHDQTQVVSTWSFNSQKMGDTLLRHPRFKEDQKLRQAIATCLCLTACGNFVLIGYSTGHVDKFNIQSGLHRGELRDERCLQTGEIRGIISDGLNQFVVTGEAGGSLKYWRFSSHKLMCKPEQLESGIRQMALHRDNGLLGVATADFGVLVIDSLARRVVRRFDACHADQITDFCFSSDSRWIVTSSLDSTVKVWDVPSGSLVDDVMFPKPVTSLTMSPQANYLATTHVGDLGIYLWINKTLYGHVALRPLKADHLPKLIEMPTVTHGQEHLEEEGDDDKKDDIEKSEDDEEMYDADWAAKQIGGLITLSNLPTSRWQHLLKLDVIKARNKPKNPVVKPVSAPFFLPTVPTLSGEMKFVLPEENENDGDLKSKVLTSGATDLVQSFSEFGQILWDGGDSEKAMALLKEKGPSAIEVEIANLAPEGGGSHRLMAKFLAFIRDCIESKFNFELAQSYLALFLKMHGESVLQSQELTDGLKDLQSVQEESWRELKQDISCGVSLVSFCKTSLVS